MSDFLERISKLTPRRLALLAVELNEKLEAAAAARREPIAIVGMACRFPGGADDPDRFWELLRDGRDAIRGVPPSRWDAEALYDPDPDAPARISTRSGGFLDRVDSFDAAFFGIAAREAQTMDPQQRLLLEVAWEALEHAGLSPERLAGSATGVFVGLCNGDHFQRALERGAEAIDVYLATGNAHSVAAGRISYCLGLQGPAITVDTACSSSLVALHLACGSLRNGESRIALSGGVNVICTPHSTIALSRGHMLAPDGRCKTFDAAADGFSRGEGCGVIVLKRLSDALADGDRVLAVVRGIAVNQDGRSSGLTVPNGPAQEAVIRAALADAGAAPADIGYVEAHGTGTALGDPIEVRALAAALGPGRARHEPLVVGSVKTNLGHLEAAAGVAGLMKVVLALQHERIPPHLHFRTPSPHIAWSEYPVVVEASGRAWPRGARRRLAGVSSFGFSGTNAHAILEEAPLPETLAAAMPERPVQCLPVSARTGDALVRLAGRYAQALAPPNGPTLADAAHTAGAGRSHLAERLAVVTGSEAEAREALTAFARGEPHSALHRGSAAPGEPSEIVFLYTGQGAQYPGMGRLLYETSPVFRDVIDRCGAILGPDDAGRTLHSVMFETPGERPALHETAWTQPALFALELAVTELWRSWGIEPAAVIGHSVGEYVAACVAGVFTVEDGLRLIAERGRLMQALPPGGSMAAVFAPVDEVVAAVAPLSDRLAIAAVNAPDSVVVSGETSCVDALLARFKERHVEGHRLFVSLAAHSPLVAPALDAMEAAARRVPMRAPRVPVAWNLTGGAPLPGESPDATYWRRHLREPVRFAEGLAALYRDGHRTFLEVGPHPVLGALAQRSLPEEGTQLLGSLRRNKDDWWELMSTLAALYVRGAPVDWPGLDRPYRRRRVALPTYPFERRSFWIDRAVAASRPAAAPTRGRPGLLGSRLPTALPCFEATLAPATAPYLADHRLHGEVLVAAPVFLEMAQAAAREALGPPTRAVESFVIRQPLVLPEAGRTVQIQLGHIVNGGTPFSIHSRPASGDGAWQLHATGTMVASAGPPAASLETPPLADIARALGPPADLDRHHARIAELGIDLGPSARSLTAAHRRDGEALVAVALPPACASDSPVWAHPVLLDGAFQAVGLAMPDGGAADDLHLLTTVDAIDLWAPLPERLWCHARLCQGGGGAGEVRADVTLRGADGAVLGIVRGACLRRATREALARVVGGVPLGWYDVVWEPVPPRPGAAALLAEPATFVPGLRARFAEIAASNGLAVYDELLPELDRLCTAHLAEALRELGFDASPGRTFTAAGEATRLGVAPRHARLFARLLQVLAEDGILRADGAGFEVTAALPPPAPLAPRYERLLARFAGEDGELRTLRRCGGELARVLRGEQDPLQLLFPGGELAEARKLYVESAFARTYNAALGEALRAALAPLPAGARLRVLELGAGTGGTTTFVLPLLPAERVEYTFTDVSPLFLERAAEQFASYPFVRRAVLDVERDPIAQGFARRGYDVVIAANVLHATADLRSALEHARQLLAPGGLLLLLEGVGPERWVDLSFGLTDGWWRFTDVAQRPSYPLIGRRAWLDLLAETGFTGAATIPDDRRAASRAAQQALIVARAPLAQRRFALLAGAGDALAEAVAERLRRRGDAVLLAAADAPDAELEPADEVIYLGALPLAVRAADDPSAPVEAQALAGEVPLRWLSRMARGEIAGRAWLVTRGATTAGGGVGEGGPWQAPLWGAGRTFALEQPARWGGLVDLAPDATTEADVDALLATLDAGDGEDQTAWRDGSRLAARLARACPPTVEPVCFRHDATYLITGGFGGLGLRVARWMAERGARHLALLGRHPDPSSEEIRGLAALGAHIVPLAGDVADASGLASLLDGLRTEAPPLRGIVHAAADLSAAPLVDLTPAQVSAMLRPKIEGTVLLERLTRAADLDFLALFSSTTALLGASGLAHYGAANAFLDAFAHAARKRGRKALSVNWGTWDSMRLSSSADRQSYRDAGLEPMASSEALEAFGRLLGGAAPQAVVACIDWSVLRPLHEARRPRPFLARMAASPAESARGTRSGPALPERLAAVPPGLRPEFLLEYVRGEVAAVLAAPEGGNAIAPDAGLFDLGMDSLMSVELKRRLERGAGRPLPSTLTFNYPNVAALAAFLDRELAGTGPSPAASPVFAPPNVVVTAAAAPAREGGLDALSEAELEARLLEKLERTR